MAISKLPLFNRKEMPVFYREPYIVDGYRKPNSSFTEALRYIFVLRNNDCLNFWTHLFPLVLWIASFLYLYRKIDLWDPYFFPLVCLWWGCCSYVLCSSVAHMLGCMSLKIRQICFLVDYMGISMYVFSGSLVTFFYVMSTESIYFRYKWTALILNGVMCTGATLLSGLSRFYWEKWRFLIRAGSYAVPYILASIPAWLRIVLCWVTGDDCTPETATLHLVGVILIIVMAFFFVSKVPERFAPGRFDVFFQSHQLFHLCAVTVSCLYMYVFPIDALVRRTALAADSNRLPDFYSTILLYVCVSVICSVFVLILSVLVVKDVLVSNKLLPPSEDSKNK